MGDPGRTRPRGGGPLEEPQLTPGRRPARRQQLDARAGPEATRAIEHQTPRRVVDRVEKEPLHATAGACPPPEETGGDHRRVVEHEHVAGLDVLREIAHPTVLERTFVPSHHEQTGVIARLGRPHGDQAGRQVVVELVGAHEGTRECRGGVGGGRAGSGAARCGPLRPGAAEATGAAPR